MRTVYTHPQFNLLPDSSGVRWYGNVLNLVEVAKSLNRVHYVALAVPTQLFPLMKDVFRVPVTSSAILSIDFVEDEKYVLSLMHGGENLIDLWTYSPKSLPAWIMNPQNFVTPSGDLIDALLGN